MKKEIYGSVEDGTFKALTEDQMKEMEAEDLAKYFNELNKHREKTLNDKLELIKTDNSEALKAEIKVLKDEIVAGNVKQLETMTTALETQGAALNKLMAKGDQEKIDAIGKVVSDNLKAIQDNVGTGGSYKFKIEAPTLKTTIALTSITNDPIGMFLPDWAEVQTQNNRLAPSLSSFLLTANDHGVIYWTDQTTRTNNAAARSDGSAAAEQVYAWTGYSETVDNVSAMVPVHKEALKHITQLQQEIQRLLTEDIAEALDDYCYTGSGTAPQIGGIYTRSDAFDAAAFIAAGGFTPTVATLKDLIVSMAAQIMKETKYNVDTVWLNPYDVLQLKGYKTTDGIPIPLITNGMIDNIKVIEANSVTAGTCVVGDSRKARLYSTGAAEIEIGYNLTGDFSKRILTILANLETSLLIRNAEVDAFLKSTDIDSDIAAITDSGA